MGLFILHCLSLGLEKKLFSSSNNELFGKTIISSCGWNWHFNVGIQADLCDFVGFVSIHVREEKIGRMIHYLINIKFICNPFDN